MMQRRSLESLYKRMTISELEKVKESGHKICEQISNLKYGEAIIVDGEEWETFWHLQFNPEKGETAEGELLRWMRLLSLDGIVMLHDFGPDRNQYHFKNITA